MGLHSGDKWKNSKGNESSLKFNEEKTDNGGFLVRKQAVMAQSCPSFTHKEPTAFGC